MKMVVRGICLLLITVHFQVVIPRTYSKYTTRRVLTTQWIDGEKLSQSKESNVGELVNVGVICYLKQVIYYLGKLH
jgi:predicted unusual protein kinase regulating ubiquinone biosynthesis (AarF/ABC1/UbiB family)